MDLLSEMLYPTPFAVSPLLPILLASLRTSKHTPNAASHVLDSYDYVIVGAGSAGSALAGRLSEMACVNVLLLEAGKSPPTLTEVPAVARSFVGTDVDWQYKTAPQKHTAFLHNNRQVAWPSGKMVGGSSVLNAMFAIRGNRKNFDDWAEGGATGWSYEEVLPYFIKMEDNGDPEFSHNGYHGVGGPQAISKPRYTSPAKNPLIETAKMYGYQFVDTNGPSQTGFFDFQATMGRGQRCSSAKAYLVPADNRTNLHVLPNAFARKVLIVNRRAVGVQFDFKGTTYVVKARREVILSAGTTNSAQLLMLSGIGPRSELKKFKIPVVADLPVGYNLQDHQGAAFPFYLASGTKSILMRLLDQRNVLQYIKSRSGVLSSAEGCMVVAFLENRTIRPRTGIPDHELYFLEVPSLIVKTQLNLRTDAFYKVFGPYIFKPLVICISQILHPKSRGRVYLRSANPYDPPIIDPQYYSHPQDMDDVLQGIKACKRLSEGPAMRKIGLRMFQTIIPGCEEYVGDEDKYFICLARSVALTLNHQVGTAKMGNPSDPTTVVDPELRVKSIKGLRVVDASVMPTVPSGNTNLPAMMIAEKAADMIKATVDCKIAYYGKKGVSPVNNKHLFTNLNNLAYPSFNLNHGGIANLNLNDFSTSDHLNSLAGGHGFTHLDHGYVETHIEDKTELLSSENLKKFLERNGQDFPNLNKDEILSLNQQQFEILKQLGLKNATLKNLNKSLFPDKFDVSQWKSVKSPKIQQFLSSNLQGGQIHKAELSSPQLKSYSGDRMYHEQFLKEDRSGLSEKKPPVLTVKVDTKNTAAEQLDDKLDDEIQIVTV